MDMCASAPTLGKAERSESAEEQPSIAPIDTTFVVQAPHRLVRLQHDLAGTDSRIRRTRTAVEFFADEPASWFERRDQPSKNIITLGQMDQDHPGVHEIERSLRQWVASDVVAKDLETGEFQSLEESDIDVRDQDSSGVADALTEPPCNRSTATSDFQTVPAGHEAAIQQMAPSARVEDRGQGGEPCGGIADRIHRAPLRKPAATLRQRSLVEKLK